MLEAALRAQGGGLAFAQNQHDKVRLIGGDGSISGALAAQRWGNYKNETLVAEPSDSASIQPIVMASDHSHAEIGEGGVTPTLTARMQKGAPVLAMGKTCSHPFCATDGSKQFIDNQSVSGGRLLLDPRREECVASNGDDVIGALCARDYKGVGTQFVGEGKVIACRTDQ